MNEDRLWLLLSLQLAEEATAEELKELEQLLKENPEASLRAEMMRNLWRSTPSFYKNKKAYDRHLQRLSSYLSEPVLKYENGLQPAEPFTEEKEQRSSFRRMWAPLAVAASILIVVILFLQEKKVPVAGAIKDQNIVSTQPGSKSKIILPDGTQVWLNAGSNLIYDNNLSGHIREVKFSGEAFFDVAKDNERPFVIHANAIDIKVVGTAFNVRSYPNEKTTETALIRGAVEITLHNNPDKKIPLKPNEKLVVNNLADDQEPVRNNDIIKKEQPMLILSKIYFNKTDSSITETEWTHDKLAFESMPLEKIIAQLERFYNVEFIVKEKRLNRLSFTGTFNNKSLDEIMEALCLSGNFHYEFNNEAVTVW